MSYAQTQFSQQLGRGPYSIADAGCFLVSFCNLLERFGENINPLDLNNYFNQHGNYVDVDHDNTLDDLAWGTVAAYDGRITTSVGGAGWPDSNDAIVKFVYKSPRTGRQTTHFCLVVDHNTGVIIDSWDGVTKHSPYGTPVAWAKYERHAPQVITPPPAAPVPAFSVENVPEMTKELRISAHLWDLNQRTWPGLVNNPVATGDAGAKFQTSQIAHHLLGGSYYLPVGSATQGYNVVDCEEPEAAPPAPVVAAPQPEPVPAPLPPAEPKPYKTNKVDGITYEAMDGAPKAMYVNKLGGCEVWSFKDVTTWRGFTSVKHLDYGQQVYIVGSALHPIPPNGAIYYMQDADFGDFKNTGHVVNQFGISAVDLSDTKPAPLPPSVDTATGTVAPPVVPAVVAPDMHVATAPAASTAPVAWKDTYQPFPKPTHYVAVKSITVKDLEGKQPDMPLPKYDPTSPNEVGKVAAYGTVLSPDGVPHYRLRTNNDPTGSFWYAVPKIDPETRTPLLLVVPANPLEPVAKVSVMRDTLVLAKAHFEKDASKFLDDILPKWFNKNKK